MHYYYRDVYSRLKELEWQESVMMQTDTNNSHTQSLLNTYCESKKLLKRISNPQSTTTYSQTYMLYRYKPIHIKGPLWLSFECCM